MREIRITVENEEFRKLEKAKQDMSWREFVLLLCNDPRKINNVLSGDVTC